MKPALLIFLAFAATAILRADQPSTPALAPAPEQPAPAAEPVEELLTQRVPAPLELTEDYEGTNVLELSQAFRDNGLEVGEGASVQYLPAEKILLHTNTAINLRRLRRLVEADRPAQIRIDMEVTHVRKRSGTEISETVQHLKLLTRPGQSGTLVQERLTMPATVRNQEPVQSALIITPTLLDDGSMQAAISWNSRTVDALGTPMGEISLTNQLLLMDAVPWALYEHTLVNGTREVLHITCTQLASDGSPVLDDSLPTDPVRQQQPVAVDCVSESEGSGVDESILSELSEHLPAGASLAYDAILSELSWISSNAAADVDFRAALARRCPPSSQLGLTLDVVRLPRGEEIDPLDTEHKSRVLMRRQVFHTLKDQPIDVRSSIFGGGEMILDLRLAPTQLEDGGLDVAFTVEASVMRGERKISGLDVDVSAALQLGKPTLIFEREAGKDARECFVLTAHAVDASGQVLD